MRITYILSEEEYLQAVNFHHQENSRIIKLLVYIALAAGIVLLGTDFSNTAEIITNVLAAFFSIAFYMLFLRILASYQAKNIYKHSTILPYETMLKISKKGIKLVNKGKEKSIAWSVFEKWKENENFYLLYTSSRQFNVIPTRQMTDIQKKELHTYLEKYIIIS